jgi:hypothetical protein
MMAIESSISGIYQSLASMLAMLLVVEFAKLEVLESTSVVATTSVSHLSPPLKELDLWGYSLAM